MKKTSGIICLARPIPSVHWHFSHHPPHKSSRVIQWQSLGKSANITQRHRWRIPLPEGLQKGQPLWITPLNCSSWSPSFSTGLSLTSTASALAVETLEASQFQAGLKLKMQICNSRNNPTQRLNIKLMSPEFETQNLSKMFDFRRISIDLK